MARAPGEGAQRDVGPADGVRGAPGVLRMRRARPHPGFWVPSARREIRGS
jgi:hypothetical protein